MRILYLFILLILLGTSIAAGGDNITLNVVPKHYEAGANDTFIISIDLNPNNNKVYSVQLEILFDKSLLEGIKVEKGDFLRQDGAQTSNPIPDAIDNSSGKINYGEKRIGTGTGVSNPGTIAVITFHVKDDAKIGSNQTFVLENINITDSSSKKLPVEPFNGDFIVIGSKNNEQPSVQSVPEKKSVISQELADLMNKSEEAEKISIKISVDKSESQNILNLAAFLRSRGTEVSDINQFSDFITCKASKRLILEISSMPFVTQITTYTGETSTQKGSTEKQPGFGIMTALIIILLIYIIYRRKI